MPEDATYVLPGHSAHSTCSEASCTRSRIVVLDRSLEQNSLETIRLRSERLALQETVIS